MSEKPTKLQKYSAPALEKGLDILELLSYARGDGLNQSQIAEGIGRSKNEIFRMLVVLEERGYVQRADGDTFTLTSRLAELGGPRGDISQISELASPYLLDLSQVTKLSCQLWALHESKFHIIAQSSVTDTYTIALPEGFQSQVLGSSAGACFLAGLETTAERRDALESWNESFDERQFNEFNNHVNACRKKGVVILPNAKVNTIIEISSPVFGRSGKIPIAALTIPVINSDDSDHEMPGIIDHLKNTAEHIREKISLLGMFDVGIA